MGENEGSIQQQQQGYQVNNIYCLAKQVCNQQIAFLAGYFSLLAFKMTNNLSAVLYGVDDLRMVSIQGFFR